MCCLCSNKFPMNNSTVLLLLKYFLIYSNCFLFFHYKHRPYLRLSVFFADFSYCSRIEYTPLRSSLSHPHISSNVSCHTISCLMFLFERSLFIIFSSDHIIRTVSQSVFFINNYFNIINDILLLNIYYFIYFQYFLRN